MTTRQPASGRQWSRTFLLALGLGLASVRAGFGQESKLVLPPTKSTPPSRRDWTRSFRLSRPENKPVAPDFPLAFRLENGQLVPDDAVVVSSNIPMVTPDVNPPMPIARPDSSKLYHLRKQRVILQKPQVPAN